MTQFVNMYITVNAYWFPSVVVSNVPIKSTEIKSIGSAVFLSVVAHNLVSVDLLLGIADNV